MHGWVHYYTGHSVYSVHLMKTGHSPAASVRMFLGSQNWRQWGESTLISHSSIRGFHHHSHDIREDHWEKNDKNSHF